MGEDVHSPLKLVNTNLKMICNCKIYVTYRPSFVEQTRPFKKGHPIERRSIIISRYEVLRIIVVDQVFRHVIMMIQSQTTVFSSSQRKWVCGPIPETADDFESLRKLGITTVFNTASWWFI